MNTISYIILLIGAFSFSHANIRLDRQELYICREKVIFTVHEHYSDVEAHFWLKDTGINLHDTSLSPAEEIPVYVEFPFYIPKLGYGSAESSQFWREFKGYGYYTIGPSNERTSLTFNQDILNSLFRLEMRIKHPFEKNHSITDFRIVDPVANHSPKPSGYEYDTLKYSAELLFSTKTRRLKEGEELEFIIRYRQHHICDAGRWQAAYTPNLPMLQSHKQMPADNPENFQIIFNASEEVTKLRLTSESSVQQQTNKQIIVTAEDWSTILVESVVAPLGTIDPFAPPQ